MTEPLEPAATASAVTAPPVEGLASPESSLPEEALASFFLPTARALVAAGFGLLRVGQPELRGGSLYVGLLTLLVAGPAAVFFVYLVTRDPDVLAVFFGVATLEVGPDVAASLATASLLLIFVGVGTIAVSIEAQVIGIAMLAGRHVGRPMSLLQALRRSRQVFWRVAIASGLLAVAGFAVGLVSGPLVRSILGMGPDASAVVSAVVGIMFGIPFAYVATGIVLGDVGPIDAYRRSIRLARARPRLALVIAIFATAVSVIQTLAVGAGGDVVTRVSDVLPLGFDSGVLPALVSVIVILAGVVALGSLTFTVAVIAAAPQVVAFIGLTHHSAGIELARREARPVRPAVPGPAVAAPDAGPSTAASGWAQPARSSRRTRLVTIPMVGLAILEALVAVSGMAGLPPG